MSIPKDKPQHLYRPHDAHIFIREGWLVTEQHPDNRFCKLAKVFKADRKGDRPPYVGLLYIHLKKFGPPSITTVDMPELRRLRHLIEIEEGVDEYGCPIGGSENE